jgi:hypothetical protein
MAFEKYQEPAPKKPEVRISGAVIKISDAAFERIFSPNSVDQVNLFWDKATRRVGFAPTTPEDRSKFAVKQAKVGWSIPARKFLAHYGITGAVAEGDIAEDHGVFAFRVRLPGETETKPADTAEPRHHGRKPKAAAS